MNNVEWHVLTIFCAFQGAKPHTFQYSIFWKLELFTWPGLKFLWKYYVFKKAALRAKENLEGKLLTEFLKGRNAYLTQDGNPMRFISTTWAVVYIWAINVLK